MTKIRTFLNRHDLSARALWIAALVLAALKLLLCSFQLMYASPDLSPIDDTLMVDLAKSIASGQDVYKRQLLRDPFYNPSLTLDMEDFSEAAVLPAY